MVLQVYKMKHAAKMSLVPFDENHSDEKALSELDLELSNILKNKELSQDDKMKLYQHVLSKYLKFEEKIDKLITPTIEKTKEVGVKVKEERKIKKRKLEFDDLPKPKSAKTWTTY